MPRIFTAKKNKGGVKEYKCENCSKIIQPGELYYYYYRYRARSKSIRCSSHWPRPSELTSSSTLSVVYGVQESIEDACSSASDGSDIVQALEDASSDIEDLISELEDKISNVENAFPNGTPVLDQLQEYLENAQQFRDDLDNAKSEAESRWSEFETEEPENPEDLNKDDYSDEEWREVSERYEEWEQRRDEAISEIIEIAGNVECNF